MLLFRKANSGVNKIKYFMISAMIFSVFSASAHEEDQPIENSIELREWCKAETEAYYIGQSVTPYNWTSSWWEKDNILFVKGSWRIKLESVEVLCSVAKGAKRKYAIYKIANK